MGGSRCILYPLALIVHAVVGDKPMSGPNAPYLPKVEYSKTYSDV